MSTNREVGAPTRRHLADRYVVALIVLFVQAGVVFGHQDMLVTRAPDGRLQGLPPEYQPAHLHLPSGSGPQRVVLQLNGKRLEFPDCLSVLFAKTSRSHMRLKASWYHDPRIIPYYLSIDIPITAPNSRGYFTGWSILVDLKKVSVLEIKAVFVTEAGASQREQELDLKTFCGSGGDRSPR